MENKYYTPAIEDWVDGLEYEYKPFYSNVWRSTVLDIECDFSICSQDGGYDDDSPKNSQSEFRVKYLDKEDIEALGWENAGLWVDDLDKEDIRTYTKLDGYSIRTNDIITPILYLDFMEDGRISIHNRHTYEENITVFEGKIKNKSRLKLLMEMLEIPKLDVA